MPTLMVGITLIASMFFYLVCALLPIENLNFIISSVRNRYLFLFCCGICFVYGIALVVTAVNKIKKKYHEEALEQFIKNQNERT
jgi:uncharacterized membrane protein